MHGKSKLTFEVIIVVTFTINLFNDES